LKTQLICDFQNLLQDHLANMLKAGEYLVISQKVDCFRELHAYQQCFYCI